MLCKQGHSVARLIHYADGSESCPSCHGISEIGKPFKYMSIPHKQDIERQRDLHAKDIEQPWTIEKGKGWTPNERFVKMYKDEPEKLNQVFSKEELKESGV